MRQNKSPAAPIFTRSTSPVCRLFPHTQSRFSCLIHQVSDDSDIEEFIIETSAVAQGYDFIFALHTLQFSNYFANYYSIFDRS